MNRIRASLVVLVLFAQSVVAAYAQSPAAPSRLPDAAHGKVIAVMDGDSLRIEGENADVRLVGIQAPKLPKGRRNFATWPHAEDAHRALEHLIANHSVSLRLAATPRDRNGRVLAHVLRDDGLWLQAELLREGWARVYTFPDNREFATELYAAEREARAARRGIWADPDYAVRSVTPGPLLKELGTFQIVEGTVVDAAKVKNRVYLNFGPDYRTDFSVAIAADVLPLFTKAKLDPLALKGKTICVRGYLRNYNGPLIDVTHPEQIELVAPNTP